MSAQTVNLARPARWVMPGLAVVLTFLLAVSTSWQSWQRNTALAEITHPALYFSAVWFSYLLWIPIVLLIGNWARRWPVGGAGKQTVWLRLLALAIAVGVAHLLADTFALWLSLSGSFPLLAGLAEKLLRWMPYELLAYLACLLLFCFAVLADELLTD